MVSVSIPPGPEEARASVPGRGARAKGQRRCAHGSSALEPAIAFAMAQPSIGAMLAGKGMVLGLASGALLAGSAATADIQKHPIGPLQEAVYDFAVAEYCGLLTPAVAEGFHLEREWIVARDGITPERE